MRAPRVAAHALATGDQILVAHYHPRTWAVVEHVEHDAANAFGPDRVMVDTARYRMWYRPTELVPCRKAALPPAEEPQP